MASPLQPNGGSDAPLLPGGLSPDSIDVTSELYTVLSRVRYTDKNASADGEQGKTGTANTPAAAGGASTSATPAAGGGGAAAAGGGGGDATAANGTGNNGTKPLVTKDLVAATDPLKHKIQQARAAVHTLPDIGRTIPEQEAEMGEWEDKIARQREVLRQLREFGIQFSHGAEGSDVEMGGTATAVGGSSG